VQTDDTEVLSDVQKCILSILLKHPWLTTKELRLSLRMRLTNSAVYKPLQVLLREKKITVKGTSTRSDPRVYAHPDNVPVFVRPLKLSAVQRKILAILLEHPWLTIQELCTRLRSSVKYIRKNLHPLEQANKVLKTRGHSGEPYVYAHSDNAPKNIRSIIDIKEKILAILLVSPRLTVKDWCSRGRLSASKVCKYLDTVWQERKINTQGKDTSGANNTPEDSQSALDVRAKILEILLNHPCLTAKELCKETNALRYLFHRHLKTLLNEKKLITGGICHL
jgi:predicted transcriptional regulator